MSFIGRQINIGIGIENTAGTAVTPTIFPKWTSYDVQGVSEKELYTAQAGTRNPNSDAIIRRKMAEGSIAVVPDVEITPYFIRMMGFSVSSATASGESAVYEHTMVPLETNVTVPATLIAEHSDVLIDSMAYTVGDSLTLSVSDGLAELSMDVKAKFPASGALTESFTTETIFAYKDYTAKFGTNVSNATAASATKLKDMELTISNSVDVDGAFLSGDNAIVNYTNGERVVEVTYTLEFANTTELSKYRDDTRNAMVISFTGASIGSAETEEILINLSRLVLEDPPIQHDLSGKIYLTQKATVYEGTEGYDIQVVVTNEADGSNY